MSGTVPAISIIAPDKNVKHEDSFQLDDPFKHRDSEEHGPIRSSSMDLTLNITSRGRLASISTEERSNWTLDQEEIQADKAAKREDVLKLLGEQSFLNTALLETEVDHFFDKLGLDWSFYVQSSAESIAQHITVLYAAKLNARVTGTFKVDLANKEEGHALYALPSTKGVVNELSKRLEYTIEGRYLHEGFRLRTADGKPVTMTDVPYRLQCYRSKGTVEAGSTVQLRLWVLDRPQFLPDAPKESRVNDFEELRMVSDTQLWELSTDMTKKLLQEVLHAATDKAVLGPVIRGLYYEDSEEFRIIVCYRQGTTHSFFSSLTDLYHSFNMFATKKYVEQFSNGFVIYSIYCKRVNNGRDDVNFGIADTYSRMKADASFAYVLPRTSLQHMFSTGQLTARETTYAYAGWKFTYHFMSRYSSEYRELGTRLGQGTREFSILERLKRKLAKESITEARIRETIFENVGIIKALYRDFENLHMPGERHNEKLKPQCESFLDDPRYKELLARIVKESETELDESVLQMFVQFNNSVLKTNFYKLEKVALSFRLDSGFLDTQDYPKRPFGIFMVLGAEFRGFHVRFGDVARGGIRVIKSRNAQAFNQNLPTLFDEVYNLASTQQRKNKDIPEGGSKGALLLALDHQTKAETSFRKYIDSLLDLLVPGSDVDMIDHYAKPEILFLGPDEGTAEMMNWASEHARLRGASFWKAFTTGKTRDRGGIPHDMYGMTTRSIHQFVLGTLEKVGIKEEDTTKLQTGGPDGDLGSNEILISKDRTIAIVDGSGVLVDPEGINREEMERLAVKREMVRNFDQSKLSKKGYFVDVEAVDITLPDDSVVVSGLHYRNELSQFHLNPASKADMFVPCGGRPAAVNFANVDQLFDESGVPRFRWIVEGANLFFTQEARLELEKRGVVLFKDASANKGGVTSSSLEVFAALALSDEEFHEHMCVHKDGAVPDFYERYVQDVHRVIERNARQEFDCIWKEHELSGEPRCVLSDTLSNKINALYEELGHSTIYNNEKIRNNVLNAACPPTLLKLVPLDVIFQRVPESYWRAMFASYLASNFVYQHGLHASEFAFFEFIQKFIE